MRFNLYIATAINIFNKIIKEFVEHTESDFLKGKIIMPNNIYIQSKFDFINSYF